MQVEIRTVGLESLELYATIPMTLEVRKILQPTLIAGGLGGMAFTEHEIAEHYIKDYDAYAERGPREWLDQFDMTNWGFFLATSEGRPRGAATVAFGTPGVDMLEGREDLALLWDIRVHPDFKGRGLGTRLFLKASEWARDKGCRQLKIETQNVNVPACRFYAKQGCHLAAINRYGYRNDPVVKDEVMLLWYLDL